MRSNRVAGITGGLIGCILVPFGVAALAHHAYVSGVVLLAAGLFLAMSALENFGITITNPLLQKPAKVFVYVVVLSAITASLAAGIALSMRTGIKFYAAIIYNFQEHSGATLLLLVGFCWLWMLRRSNPESSKL